jgi:tetratricopeptide (TPR) repeat protein
MTSAVLAERKNDIVTARAGYERAHALDPADPVPLRFLAELNRHHTGDWALAARQFRTLLAGSPDAISRAVALHGLGKMTIHAGRFDEGLALFEQSLEAYPLALTYRNLAVYWNSEGDRKRAEGYTQQALALAPDDAYNQIFAATYLAESGEAEAALAVATRHQDLLPASYNLAAIHALLGHRDQALALLERHFYSYEQYDAVRKKEMQEARDDIVFARYHQDPEFVALTAMADSDPDSFRRELSDTGSR